MNESTRDGLPRPVLVPAAGLCAAVWLALAATPVTWGEDDYREPPVSKLDRDHWSFLPLSRPDPPSVRDAKRAQNAIDLFVLRKLQEEELTLQDPAPRATLARRLAFDLTGLPPQLESTPQADDRRWAGRYAEQLLASPAYGERWAQHWLDLARFAETDGFEHDKVRPEAWRFRDWVVRALNAGMPYNEFVQLQLAGDELAGESAAALPTAFCLSGPDMPDINSQQERRHSLLNEMTSTVGAVLLGLQIGCAQCHDHKYDPISQADFYRMRAIFEPAVHVERNKSVSVLQENGPPQPAHLWVRGDWRRPGVELDPGFLRVVNAAGAAPPTNAPGATSGRRLALARWLTSDARPLVARVMANRVWQHHFGEGLVGTPSDFGIMGDLATHPQLLDYLAVELVESGWSLKHLQRLIVNSATYQQSSRLADGASAAAKDGWSAALERDPDNLLLSRYPRRRLEGEAIRDAMLASSDSLDRRMGGPGVRPPLAPELVATLLKDQWEVSPVSEHRRRSLYIFARRNLRFPIFEAFDRPDPNASCARRNQSTTAPQSLLLLNSRLSLNAAQRLAGWIGRRQQAPAEQARLAFRRTLSRDPTPQELAWSERHLRDQAALLREQGRPGSWLALPIPAAEAAESDVYEQAALTDLCLALLNCNEFLYLD